MSIGTRIPKERVLDNFVRGSLYGFISQKPGAYFNEMKQSLNLQNGAIAYHLHILERHGMIKSEMDGYFKRYHKTLT